MSTSRDTAILGVTLAATLTLTASNLVLGAEPGSARGTFDPAGRREEARYERT
jgi:hypothetical protein